MFFLTHENRIYIEMLNRWHNWLIRRMLDSAITLQWPYKCIPEWYNCIIYLQPSCNCVSQPSIYLDPVYCAQSVCCFPPQSIVTAPAHNKPQIAPMPATYFDCMKMKLCQKPLKPQGSPRSYCGIATSVVRRRHQTTDNIKNPRSCDNICVYDKSAHWFNSIFNRIRLSNELGRRSSCLGPPDMRPPQIKVKLA